jgi:hypothetical protein
VELTILALIAAVVDTFAGGLGGTRVLVSLLVVLGVVTVVGHLLSILSSSKLK